ASHRAVWHALGRDNYRDLLLDVGFAQAETRSIAADVYPPLGRFLKRRLRDPDMHDVNPIPRYFINPQLLRLNRTALPHPW
ncbi:MAG: hypothetical protein ACRDTO_15215, partial [Mycobacterium sp.]